MAGRIPRQRNSTSLDGTQILPFDLNTKTVLNVEVAPSLRRSILIGVFAAIEDHHTSLKLFSSISLVPKFALSVGGHTASPRIRNFIAVARDRIRNGGRKCVQSSKMSDAEIKTTWRQNL